MVFPPENLFLFCVQTAHFLIIKIPYNRDFVKQNIKTEKANFKYNYDCLHNINI